MFKKNKGSHLIVLGTLIAADIVSGVSASTGSAVVVSPAPVDLLKRTSDIFLSAVGLVLKTTAAFFCFLANLIASFLIIPIFLLIVFKVIYYNYFVLKGGSFQEAITGAVALPYKAFRYVYKGISNLFKDNVSEDENEKILLSKESSVGLISISELTNEAKEIRDKLTNLSKGADIQEISGKIDTLRQRIWITRGVFSDKKFLKFGSYVNSFWYYFTTLFFASTRRDYNDLEKQLNEYKKVLSSCLEIRNFINIFKDQQQFKNVTLSNLLGNADNEGSFLKQAKVVFGKIKELENVALKASEDFRKELTNVYINSICFAINNEVGGEQENISEVLGILSDKNIEKFESVFSKIAAEKLKSFRISLRKEEIGKMITNLDSQKTGVTLSSLLGDTDNEVSFLKRAKAVFGKIKELGTVDKKASEDFRKKLTDDYIVWICGAIKKEVNSGVDSKQKNISKVLDILSDKNIKNFGSVFSESAVGNLRNFKIALKVEEVREMILDSNKQGKDVALSSLLGNTNNEVSFLERVKAVVEKIRELGTVDKEASESLRKELTDTYINLIRCAIEKEVDSKQENIGKVLDILSDENIEKFGSVFSDSAVEDLKSFRMRLNEVGEIISLDQEGNSALGSIVGLFGSWEETEEKVKNLIKDVTTSGNSWENFLYSLFGKENLDVNRKELLLEIMKRYGSLSSLYNRYKSKKVEGFSFGFCNNVNAFYKKLRILEMIFSNEKINKQLVDAVSKISSADKFINDVDKELSSDIQNLQCREGFGGYLDRMAEMVGTAITKLNEQRSQISKNGQLISIVNSEFNLRTSRYEKIIEQIRAVREYYGDSWLCGLKRRVKESVIRESDESYLMKMAKDICESKEIEQMLECVDDLCKASVTKVFGVVKTVWIAQVKKLLNEEFVSRNQQIKKLVSTLQIERDLVDVVLTGVCRKGIDSKFSKTTECFCGLLDRLEEQQSKSGKDFGAFFSELGFKEKDLEELSAIRSLIRLYSGMVEVVKYEDTNVFLRMVVEVIGEVKKLKLNNEEYLNNFYHFIGRRVLNRVSGFFTFLDKDLQDLLQQISLVLPEETKKSLEFDKTVEKAIKRNGKKDIFCNPMTSFVFHEVRGLLNAGKDFLNAK